MRVEPLQSPSLAPGMLEAKEEYVYPSPSAAEEEYKMSEREKGTRHDLVSGGGSAGGGEEIRLGRVRGRVGAG